jgi:hypothetical protein
MIEGIRKIFAAMGLPISSPRMDAIIPSGGQLDEVRELAAASRARFRSVPEVVTIDLTPPKDGICSGDLDLEKGGTKANFLAIRKLRARAEAFEKHRPKEAYLLGNVNPK